ncbi:hypothetical protein F5884DRAFT_752768 [Xylogone sp. PMI_703]|nr:hypothetical protein F5884DRAFT_752768 [Xylogone sp. PMI_703]
MRGIVRREAAGSLCIPLVMVAQLGLALGAGADNWWPTLPSSNSPDDSYATSSAVDASPPYSSLPQDVTSTAGAGIPTSSTCSSVVSSTSSSLPRPIPTTPALSSPSSSPSPFSSSSTVVAMVTPVPTSTSGDSTSSGSLSSISPPVQSDPLPSHGWSTQHRNLVIILSVVLGVFGIVLIISTIYFAWKYRRDRRPFGRRGASPINDEEIATWRGSSDRKEVGFRLSESEITPPRKTSTTLLFIDSDQAWNGTPAPPPAFGTFSSNNRINISSSIVRAPNARAGLTDEAIPGEDPFITPAKRKSNRLSKAPGHGRSRSSRSSLSTKSIWNYQSERHYTTRDRMTSWYDPNDDSPCNDAGYSRQLSSSPTDSTHDRATTPLGGLSPRPASHFRHAAQSSLESADDIGRAIS